MSYCRVGEDSDLYLVRQTKEPLRIQCYGCLLSPTAETWHLESTVERNTLAAAHYALREHLKAHQDAGHKVPERVFERLHKEMLNA